MKCIFFIISAISLFLGYALGADLPNPPFGTEIETRMINQHTIHIPVTGCVTGQFNKAIHVLNSSNILEKIQIAYAAQLPVGEKPEFKVETASEGHYYYVNKHKERADVYELRRQSSTQTNFFVGVMYVQGERSFGMFESLITMRVSPVEGAEDNLLKYNADVHVYPHCMALRIFLKYCPGIKRYFRNKTAEMQGIITGVFNHMIAA